MSSRLARPGDGGRDVEAGPTPKETGDRSRAGESLVVLPSGLCLEIDLLAALLELPWEEPGWRAYIPVLETLASL